MENYQNTFIIDGENGLPLVCKYAFLLGWLSNSRCRCPLRYILVSQPVCGLYYNYAKMSLLTITGTEHFIWRNQQWKKKTKNNAPKPSVAMTCDFVLLVTNNSVSLGSYLRTSGWLKSAGGTVFKHFRKVSHAGIAPTPRPVTSSLIDQGGIQIRVSSLESKSCNHSAHGYYL